MQVQMMDLFRVSENGGDSWRKIPVTNLGLAPRSFVNDIKQICLMQIQSMLRLIIIKKGL